MTHGHSHGHSHELTPERAASIAYYRTMATAVRELLIQKGILTDDEVNGAVAAMEARGPGQGAKVVARAWTDPDFKARLLADGRAACDELGIPIDPTRLVVVENTESEHNVIVCTLCSCYPRMLLGLPPDWYKAREYRSRAVREPRAVLREFGTEIPADRQVRVHDSTADMRYMVLPRRPEGTEGWSEAQLAALVTRNCMIGVALPRAPSA